MSCDHAPAQSPGYRAHRLECGAGELISNWQVKISVLEETESTPYTSLLEEIILISQR
jgi:hypothetical protein